MRRVLVLVLVTLLALSVVAPSVAGQANELDVVVTAPNETEQNTAATISAKISTGEGFKGESQNVSVVLNLNEESVNTTGITLSRGETETVNWTLFWNEANKFDITVTAKYESGYFDKTTEEDSTTMIVTESQSESSDEKTADDPTPYEMCMEEADDGLGTPFKWSCNLKFGKPPLNGYDFL